MPETAEYERRRTDLGRSVVGGRKNSLFRVRPEEGKLRTLPVVDLRWDYSSRDGFSGRL